MSLSIRLVRLSVLALGLYGPVVVSLSAQQPVTRAQAVAAALARGARAALGRADTAAAGGVLRGARAYPNPSFAATYTKDVPRYHYIADLLLDLPWLRSVRIGAAAAARDATGFGFAFERAAIRFDVDTTYTRALATAAHARLSRRNERDADSLLTMARLRREVGDASELDVRLAAVNAGQLENVASDDPLTSVAALLSVQLAMGRSEEHTSELQSQSNLVCRLLLEKKKKRSSRTYKRTRRLERVCISAHIITLPHHPVGQPTLTTIYLTQTDSRCCRPPSLRLSVTP